MSNPPSEHFDVFLSHNSKDKPLARTLKAWLETNGLRVWFDAEELRPGLPWLTLLEQGIRSSKAVAVLFGPAGIGPWEDEEMQSALQLAVRNKLPVIPVVLPDAGEEPGIPMFLGNRTWVDLRSGFVPASIALLLWGITGKKLAASDIRTPSSGPLPVFGVKGTPSIPRQLPPRATAEEYFGRNKQLQALIERLRAGKNAAVVGPPGMGKTALAAEALVRLVGEKCEKLAGSPFPDGIVYLDLYRHKGNADAVWNDLARAFIGDTSADRPAEQRARLACAGRHALVVFEGAEEADGKGGRAQLRDIVVALDGETNLQLVLTREKTQSFAVGTIHLEEPLEADEGAALFDRLAGGAVTGQARVDILALLAGHPLALTWVGSLLSRRTESPADLLADWRRGNLPSLADPDHENHTLRWLFERSTRGLGPAERTAIAAAGLLAHAPFPRSAIEAALGHNSEQARKALVLLVERNILRLLPASDCGGDTWQFSHILGFQFATRTQSGCEALQELLTIWARGHLQQSIQSGQVPNLEHAIQHATAVLRDNNTEASYFLALFAMYEAFPRLADLGQLGYARLTLGAFEVWMRCWPITKAIDPEYIREKAVWLEKLGGLALALGKWGDAQRAAKQGLEVRKFLVRLHPDDREALHDLASGYAQMGNLSRVNGNLPESEDLYYHALSICEKLLQTEPGNLIWTTTLAACHGRIGHIAEAQGRFAAAQAAYQKSYFLNEVLVNARPSNRTCAYALALSCEEVGNLAKKSGDFARAIKHLGRALSIREHLAETDLANVAALRLVAISHSHLGDLELEYSHLAEAERHYTRAKSVSERVVLLAPNNMTYRRERIAIVSNFSRLADEQHKPREALRLSVEVLSESKNLARANPHNCELTRDLALSYERAGMLAKAQGRMADAERLLRAAWRVSDYLTKLDPTNLVWRADQAHHLEVLGQLSLARHDFQSALSMIGTAHTIWKNLTETVPEETRWQHNLMGSSLILADLTAVQGRASETKALLNEASLIGEKLAQRDKLNPEWMRDLAVCANKHALFAERDGQYAEALLHAEKGLSIIKQLAADLPDQPKWRHDHTNATILTSRLRDKLSRKRSGPVADHTA